MSDFKLVATSDTHGVHHDLKIPECDLLIHAGDCTYESGQAALRSFCKWIEEQPAKHKVFICGNHDWAFQEWPEQARALVKQYAPSAIYLENESVEIEGIKIFGSPITPNFFDWAFNCKRGPDIRAYWDKIPSDTDVLITHGPPVGILDKTQAKYGNLSVGCKDLYEAVLRVQPKYHFFGHIHPGYGSMVLNHPSGKTTSYFNCSYVNEGYRSANKPHEVIYAHTTAS